MLIAAASGAAPLKDGKNGCGGGGCWGGDGRGRLGLMWVGGGREKECFALVAGMCCISTYARKRHAMAD